MEAARRERRGPLEWGLLGAVVCVSSGESFSSPSFFSCWRLMAVMPGRTVAVVGGRGLPPEIGVGIGGEGEGELHVGYYWMDELGQMLL